MATADEIQSFLNDFKIKLNVWDIVFREDRGKNAQTLLLLDITPKYREEVLKTLEVKDYSEGPKTEKLYGGSDMWVFGKNVKSHEVYIKITLGFSNAPVICISFHVAEHSMKYPFKK